MGKVRLLREIRLLEPLHPSRLRSRDRLRKPVVLTENDDEEDVSIVGGDASPEEAAAG